MKKLVQLKNKENENLDPINLNYEKRIKQNSDNIELLKGTIVWENSDSTLEFASQNIVLDFSNCDKFDVICRLSTEIDNRTVQPVYKGMPTRLMLTGYAGNDNAYVRDVIIHDGNVYFGDAFGYGIGNNNNFTNPTNNALIPLYIIGYKTGLF